MPTLLLFIVFFFGGLVLIDFFRKKDLLLSKDLMKQLNELENEVIHLKDRIEHLETIASEDDFDLWQAERNKKGKTNDKAHLKSN